MELMEDLDPEQARAIVDPALRLMIDAAHRYVLSMLRSGPLAMLTFGPPLYCALFSPSMKASHPIRLF